MFSAIVVIFILNIGKTSGLPYKNTENLCDKNICHRYKHGRYFYAQNIGCNNDDVSCIYSIFH